VFDERCNSLPKIGKELPIRVVALSVESDCAVQKLDFPLTHAVGCKLSAPSSLDQEVTSAPMLLSIAPARPLATYVKGYWFVQDVVGNHRGKPISTSPQPGAA
jgi:hypothetical protein